MSKQNLNYPFLLMTYLICADEEIHNQEIQCLKRISDELALDETSIEEMDKILAGNDDRISSEDIIRFVAKQDREATLKGLVVVANSDGYCDPVEKMFLRKVSKRWRIPLKKLDEFIVESQKIAPQSEGGITRENNDEQLSLGARMLQSVENVLSKEALDSLGKIVPGFEEKIELLRQEILLSGPEYDDAIKVCTEIAKEDLVFTEEALDKTKNNLNLLAKGLSNLITGLESKAVNSAAKAAKEVVSQLLTDHDELERDIEWNIEQIRKSIYKKRRAVNYFTVSFLGKTKAGKSTLHAIVTGEGWEAIGVGKQRTTRFNRVYEWKNIRVIDTPGIGAPGGRSDEEIAKSVIDESDVVCFVLTNNNQQETEFQFLKLLKDKAKPLIVLLNVKENLQHPYRLKRFIENPERLFSTEKNKLGGHIDRIRHYSNEFYGNDYFDIVPVQLLAAQMSRQNESGVDTKLLFKVSQLQRFLDSIRVSLIENGPIRRSQTLLGCTAADVEAPYNWIQEKAEGYLQFSTTLKKSSDIYVGRLESAGKDSLSRLKSDIKSPFQDLKNSIQSFAEDNWDSKESELNRAWEKHLKNKNIKARVEAIINNVAEDYVKEVIEIIEEIGKEMQSIAELKGLSFNLSEQDSSTATRSAFKWGGAIISAVGSIVLIWHPMGWAILIGGMIINQLKSLFSSKSEMRRKAVVKIGNSLRDQIDNLENSIFKKSSEEFKKQQVEMTNSVKNYFETLVAGLEGMGNELDTAQKALSSTINTLNSCYAKRVLDWCEGKNTPLIREDVENIVDSVTRTIGKEMTIKVRRDISLIKDEKQILNILQENVNFEIIC